MVEDFPSSNRLHSQHLAEAFMKSHLQLHMHKRVQGFNRDNLVVVGFEPVYLRFTGPVP